MMSIMVFREAIMQEVQFFLTLFKKPLTPPPFRLNITWLIVETFITKITRKSMVKMLNLD